MGQNVRNPNWVKNKLSPKFEGSREVRQTMECKESVSTVLLLFVCQKGHSTSLPLTMQHSEEETMQQEKKPRGCLALQPFGGK